jgi:hypothetical protein
MIRLLPADSHYVLALCRSREAVLIGRRGSRPGVALASAAHCICPRRDDLAYPSACICCRPEEPDPVIDQLGRSAVRLDRVGQSCVTSFRCSVAAEFR